MSYEKYQHISRLDNIPHLLVFWRSYCRVVAQMTIMQELVSLAKKEQERLSGTPTKSYYISEKIPQAPKDWKVMRMGKRLTKEQKKFAKENSHKVDPMVVPNAK